jgi:lysophospholipase L1-like esterase
MKMFPLMKNVAGALAVALLGFLCAEAGFAQEADHWKTAFVKRGFAGTMDVAWAGSRDASLLAPVYVPFDGAKVRVHLDSSHKDDFVLENLILVKAKDREGHAEGEEYPILFSGSPSIEIKAKSPEIVSDEIAVPLTKGYWLLKQKYGTGQSLYAFDVDGYFGLVPDGEPQFKNGSWPGNVSRVDVLTKDSRPSVLCYGDSITQGFGATPNSGNRYPELLGEALGKPVLNFGSNGDLAVYSKALPGRLKKLEGVETVVYLMGINDIITGKVARLAEYTATVAPLVDVLRKDGRRIYLGTLLPAKGYEKFDADPAKETLRQEINGWIRGQAQADGVIDFDGAVRDPADPAKMKTEYQSDFLHPSDEGYRKMAETAAARLGQ